MPDFLPRRDADLLAWTLNLSEKLSADPTAYHLTAEQAAQYASVQMNYSDAYTLANQPSTRGLLTVAKKDAARVTLVAVTRRLAKTLSGLESITDTQRSALGFPDRKGSGSPITPPLTAPFLIVDSVQARTVTLSLRNEEEVSRRGKPKSAAGALIYTYVGEEPPTRRSDWELHAHTTRTVVRVSFPQEVPNGATVWFTANWFSPRAEASAGSNPIRTNLPGGLAVPQANLMRRAA